jgi:amino acid permease
MSFYRNLVNVFLCIAQIGGFAIYILFISKNLQSVFASDAIGFDKDYRIFLLAILVPTILICSIRNLDKLAPVTLIATVCEFYTLSVVFYYFFSTNPFPKFSERPMIAKPEQLPIFFGAGNFFQINIIPAKM